MEWTLNRAVGSVSPIAVGLLVAAAMLAAAVGWWGSWGMRFAGVGTAVLAPIFFAGLRLRTQTKRVTVRAESGILHLDDDRWPIDTLGWATSEDGELTVFDLDGVILHTGRYADEPVVTELVEWIRAHRPQASEMAEQRARRAAVTEEARELLAR